MAESSRGSLYERINRVSAEAKRVAKEGKNSHFGYAYATESDISDMLRPLLAKHGVCLLYLGPDRETVFIEWGEKQALYRIWVKYQLVNVDDPAERETISCPGEALDAQDKGMNKALTAAAKYAWLKIFHLSTGDAADETDSQAYADRTVKTTQIRSPETRGLLGQNGVEALKCIMEGHGVDPESLTHEMARQGLTAGLNLNSPETWPVTVLPKVHAVVKFLANQPREAAPEVAELTAKPERKAKAPVADKAAHPMMLIDAVKTAWTTKWYPDGRKPGTGQPKTALSVIAAMMRGGEWNEIPEGPEREKQMIADIMEDRVMPDGTKIPF